jgi:hypothetical protein
VEAVKDARLLLRNVLPGLAIILEFLFFAWACGVLDQQATKEAWNSLTKDAAAVILGVVTLFVASGAAGYIIANIYHFLLNHFFWFFDYQAVLRNLTNKGDLEAYRLDGTQIRFDERVRWYDWQLCRRGWVIVTAIWAERRETNQQIKATSERAEQLVNIAHGAGTLFVGSLVAWAVAFIWGFVVRAEHWYSLGEFWYLWYALGLSWYSFFGLLALLLVLIHFVSLQWTALIARDFIASVIQNQVRYDRGKDGQAVRFYYVDE